MTNKLENSLKFQLNNRINKTKMVAFLNSNSAYFQQAIEIALTNRQPEAWRAAWLLTHVVKKNDKRVKSYIQLIISTLEDRKDGHQRELLKILEKMELNGDQEGHLFDVCMNIWEAVKKSPSVRIVAFRLIHKIAQKYPELNNEIEFLAQSHYTETLSPGIKHSLQKIRHNR